MRWTGALLCALACASCAGNEPAPAAPVVEPAIDPHKAELDARGMVNELYQTISRAQTDSLFALLGDPIVVFGPRKLDAVAGRANVLVALGKLLDPRAKVHAQLRSTGLTVMPSPGGHSAWMFDVVYVDSQPLMVSAVLSNTGGIWALTAAMIAVAPGGKLVRAESARDAVVPPGSSASAKVSPEAADVADKLKPALLDQAQWGDELAASDSAIFIGPTSGEIAHGKDAIGRMWKARLAANTREATSSELTAFRTPDGELAWVSGAMTRVADGSDVLPLRVFAIYQKTATGWRLAALHEAVAIDDAGSGTAFKKILPPVPSGEAPRVETAHVDAPPGASGPPAGDASPVFAPAAGDAAKVEIEMTGDPKADTAAAKPDDAKAKAKTTKKAKKKKPKKKPKPASKPADGATPAAADTGATTQPSQ